jgi:hypothetical protein
MTFTITIEELQKHTLNVLKQNQKAFNKNPNSLNWYTLTRAMMVHQQAHGLYKDLTVQALLNRLPNLTMGEWDEAIVQHTTGMRIDQALA